MTFQVTLLRGSVLALVTRVHHPSTVCPGVQAQGRLGLVPLAALVAQVGLVAGVGQAVDVEVVAAAALVRAVGAPEGLHPFMDPHVLLQVGARPVEDAPAVRALVGAPTQAPHHPTRATRDLEQLLCVGVLGEQVLAQNAPGWKLALADRAATLATIGCVLLAVLKQRASRLRHEVAPLTRKCAPLVCRLLVPPQVVLGARGVGALATLERLVVSMREAVGVEVNAAMEEAATVGALFLPKHLTDLGVHLHAQLLVIEL